MISYKLAHFKKNGVGLKNQITITLFKVWPTNCFSKTKSYNFHFHENNVTCCLHANGLCKTQTVDCRLQTESKTQAGVKCRPSIKCGCGINVVDDPKTKSWSWTFFPFGRPHASMLDSKFSIHVTVNWYNATILHWNKSNSDPKYCAERIMAIKKGSKSSQQPRRCSAGNLNDLLWKYGKLS